MVADTRAVLVIGATDDIGLAIAKAFGAAGWRVGINSFEPAAAIEPILNMVAEAGAPEVRYFEEDLRETSAGVDLVEAAVAQFGVLDGLVNNIGVQEDVPTEDNPENDWNLMRNLDLDVSFRAIKAVLPRMKARRWGRIINVVTAHGLHGLCEKGAYTATEHVLVELTKAVALEAAGTGVTINAICVGAVPAPMVKKKNADEMRIGGFGCREAICDTPLQTPPTGSSVSAEEIGALAVHLAGDTACSITGASMCMDKDWTAK